MPSIFYQHQLYNQYFSTEHNILYYSEILSCELTLNHHSNPSTCQQNCRCVAPNCCHPDIKDPERHIASLPKTCHARENLDNVSVSVAGPFVIKQILHLSLSKNYLETHSGNVTKLTRCSLCTLYNIWFWQYLTRGAYLTFKSIFHKALNLF